MKTWNGTNSFQAQIVRAADGDTLLVLVRLMWGVWVEKYVRLIDLESWELGTHDDAKAKRARDKIDSIYCAKKAVLFPTTRGLDNHGRIRARMTVEGSDIAQSFVDLGVAWWKRNPNGELDALHAPSSAVVQVEA